MDPRLQQAIGTPRIQNQAQELVQLSLAALDQLKALDESLYERFVATRSAPTERATESLKQLWVSTFKGMLELLVFCRQLEAEAKPANPFATEEPSGPFDFGDLEGGGQPTVKEELSIGAHELGDLLDGFDAAVTEAVKDEGDAERWAKVTEKLISIEYGLRSQHTEALERTRVAFESNEIGQVLGILDDVASSSSEGVHALVTAVYTAFLPETNPATVVPGYLTSLGRALLVRRGLAELASTLAPYNDALQGSDPTKHAPALAAVKSVLHTFVSSVVCRAMRPADRWQMVEFDRELGEQPPAAARLTSEGLVKYLDSLGSINQREVLLVHDQRTIEAMREALSNARQLVDISPRTAADELDRAYQSAQRLRGRAAATDQLIVQLERYAPTSSNAGESSKFLERLEAVLAAASGTG
ncbi:MAG TPA: hypothetical protein VGM90_16990 [Kofleriaceae bacterium]